MAPLRGAMAAPSVLAASSAQSALLTSVPPELAEAANAAPRDLLIALGDGAR